MSEKQEAFDRLLELKNSNEVDHPSHYQGKMLEVIEVIDDFKLNFNVGNAIKYLLRAGKKGDAEVDLKKALWYIQREISGL